MRRWDWRIVLTREELEYLFFAQLFPITAAFIPPPPKVRAAAVLVPLIEREHGTTMLFTRRTEHLKDHPGQICFPGGGVEQVDTNPAATAVRETSEELGIDPDLIELVGSMSPLVTGTGFSITPVVGFLSNKSVWAPHHHEVEEVFEIPLNFLVDERNHAMMNHEHQGQFYRLWSMPYEDKFVWGATAQIIRTMYESIASAGKPDIKVETEKKADTAKKIELI